MAPQTAALAITGCPMCLGAPLQIDRRGSITPTPSHGYGVSLPTSGRASPTKDGLRTMAVGGPRPPPNGNGYLSRAIASAIASAPCRKRARSRTPGPRREKEKRMQMRNQGMLLWFKQLPERGDPTLNHGSSDLVLLGGLCSPATVARSGPGPEQQAPPSLRASRPPFPLTGLRLRNQSSAHHRPWDNPPTRPRPTHLARTRRSCLAVASAAPVPRRSHHRLHPRPPTSRSRSSRHTGARNSIQRGPPAGASNPMLQQMDARAVSSQERGQQVPPSWMVSWVPHEART